LLIQKNRVDFFLQVNAIRLHTIKLIFHRV